MMFTRRHEYELGKIKALAYDLDQRVRAAQEQLERIGEAQEQQLATPERSPSSDGEAFGGGPLIAFVHIPKTAGGTAKDMLARTYGHAGLHNSGNYLGGPGKTARKLTRRPGGWTRWQRGGGRVAIGHVPYGLFREHLPADARYMTFLREPVDRVLSHYYGHVHRTGTLADHRKRVVTDSLEEALEMHLSQLSNLATRFLCGDPAPMAELSTPALDDAKANLREFAFVGIQERLVESIVLLQRTLRVGLVPYLNRHVNIDRPTVEEIPGEQRALITEHNRLDVELYWFAQGLFEDAVAAADEGFAGDVETLRASSADANEEALQRAREWLDSELPAGTAKPKDALLAAAKAAGVSPAALQHVSKLLPLKRELDNDGHLAWRRMDEDHGDDAAASGA